MNNRFLTFFKVKENKNTKFELSPDDDHLSLLPREIILMILQYLDKLSDIGGLAGTNRSLRSYIMAQQFDFQIKNIGLFCVSDYSNAMEMIEIEKANRELLDKEYKVNSPSLFLCIAKNIVDYSDKLADFLYGDIIRDYAISPEVVKVLFISALAEIVNYLDPFGFKHIPYLKAESTLDHVLRFSAILAFASIFVAFISYLHKIVEENSNALNMKNNLVQNEHAILKLTLKEFCAKNSTTNSQEPIKPTVTIRKLR